MNIILNFSIFILITSSVALSSPVPFKKDASLDDGRVLYDQRQEGEWNVRADLKNFVILIIPTQTSTTAPAVGGAGGASLLDFLTRAVPKRSHLKKAHHHNHMKKIHYDPAQETRHFIEAKAAPYHVDISTTKSHLAKLRPEPIVPINAEEIVIAKSPTITLVKDEINNRNARAFVLTVPEEEIIISKTEDKKNVKGELKKKKDVEKTTLKLLGAENEQCGPGLERDSQGICRTIKN